MRTTLLRAGALACALMTTTCLTAPALAQVGQTTPPEQRSVDANGVDMISGDYVFSLTEAAIGSGEGALALTRTGTNGPGETNWQNVWLEQTVADLVVTVNVVLGDRTESFSRTTNTSFTPALANGASLTGMPGTDYVYVGPDGTVITFGTPEADPQGESDFCSHDNSDANGCKALALSIVRPNGARLDFDWDVRANCVFPDPEALGRDCDYAWRLDTVSNNFGYEIDFAYVTNSYSFTTGTPDFFVRSGASLSNRNVTGETPLTVSYDRSTAGVLDVIVPGPTGDAPLTWRLTSGSGTFAIRRPGSSSDDISVAYGSGGVTQMVRDGLTTDYARSVSGSAATTDITQSDGVGETSDPVTRVIADIDKDRVTSVRDPLNRTTAFHYDGSDRLERVVQPEGNEAVYSYDARGNVTRVRLREKGDTGDTGDDIVSEADYVSSCSNVVTCNLPTATRDARENQTDYTYDATHGGVLTVTAPAPAGGAARPQTRYAYSQISAVSGQPVYQLTAISACAAGSTASPTCVGTASETRTVIGYDNVNIRPTSVETRSGNTSGDGALSATTFYAFNPYGDVTSIDGPIDNDTISLRYDAARRPVGSISPDPDGPASGGEHLLKRRAQRIVYRGDGQVSAVDRGTVEGTSDSDWASFATLESVQTEYDAHNRPFVQRLVSGSTTYALTQTGYDGYGRPRCAAQRMNPSEFATTSLPSDACALDSAGSYGPDRIARTSYDVAGRVTKVETGVNVSGVAADEATTTYTDNGRVATVRDGEGNLTTYAYDGFDRLYRASMPSTTQGAGTSSTTDYEELSYDKTGNVTSRRLRDGNSIGFTYDALNRPIAKNLPGSELDIAYAYDNLGRMISATQTAISQSVTLAYDALGRNVSQANYLGTIGYGYDLAGRRTSMTYPGGGPTIGYVYTYAGDLAAIVENPGGSSVTLASYGIDDRGRRTRVIRGNGTETSYQYDNADRLTQLVQDLNGSTNDLTLDFSHDPAGQIVSNTRSNTAYSFIHSGNASVADTVNGLNQLTTSGVSHDSRGNISAIGGTSFGYNSENQMISAGGDAFDRDPLGRMYYSTEDPQLTRFLFDGNVLIGEYDYSVGVLRRFVQGPGGEPVAWYEGSGTSTRRYFHADERGSVIAVSDGAGNLVGSLNRYDEYGDPQDGEITGRFGYTGQMWLPEARVYDYRNRAYHSGRGRFMQTDPIGFDGGMNLYAYVGNDPVNFTDPLGLTPEDGIITIFGHRPTLQDYISGAVVIVAVQAVREAISGVQAPECGDNASAEELAQCAITVHGTRPKRLSVCMLNFLGSQGIRSPALNDIRFIRGMDANIATRSAERRGNGAITLGRNIYVRHDRWDAITNAFRGPTFFEEITHSLQWDEAGQAAFAAGYLLSSGVARVTRGDAHDNNIERQAISLSRALFHNFNHPRNNFRCPSGS